MSTRAMYTFMDNSTTVHVYKHHDGYPEGAIDFIGASIPYAWELPRFEASDFAAAFVAANKHNGGGGVRLCGTDIKDPWDFACDVEFHYTITLNNDVIWVQIDSTDWWGNKPKSETMFHGSLTDAIKKYL